MISAMTNDCQQQQQQALHAYSRLFGGGLVIRLRQISSIPSVCEIELPTAPAPCSSSRPRVQKRKRNCQRKTCSGPTSLQLSQEAQSLRRGGMDTAPP